ncbi:MAG: hypothetical protein GYA76_00210 [Verrucomicrobia bacterium]|nr:hypothetical protein [Verrucomicrobiota bacterium]HOH41412.1 hypothetical protein [Verrucomicrobiota bacterium]
MNIASAFLPSTPRDTSGCIAQAFYREIPDGLLHRARELVDPTLLRMVETFHERFAIAS